LGIALWSPGYSDVLPKSSQCVVPLMAKGRTRETIEIEHCTLVTEMFAFCCECAWLGRNGAAPPPVLGTRATSAACLATRTGMPDGTKGAVLAPRQRPWLGVRQRDL